MDNITLKIKKVKTLAPMIEVMEDAEVFLCLESEDIETLYDSVNEDMNNSVYGDTNFSLAFEIMEREARTKENLMKILFLLHTEEPHEICAMCGVITPKDYLSPYADYHHEFCSEYVCEDCYEEYVLDEESEEVAYGY